VVGGNLVGIEGTIISYFPYFPTSPYLITIDNIIIIYNSIILYYISYRVCLEIRGNGKLGVNTKT